MLAIVAYLVIIDLLELELKFESKDILFVAFQQNNPLVKEPCMSREFVIFHHPPVKSC